MEQEAPDLELLIVQDDPAEALLMREEFAENKLVNRIHVAHDARRALAYLDGEPPFTRPAVPGLILLDVNIPGRGGRAVLHHLRSRPRTADVPVILLTDSREAERILRTESLPVQGYAIKPVDFPCLVSVVRKTQALGFEVLRPLAPPGRK